jgi:hypothetical protein
VKRLETLKIISAAGVALLAISGCDKKAADEGRSGMLSDSAAAGDTTGAGSPSSNKPTPFPVEHTPAAAEGDTRPPGMVEDSVTGRAAGPSPAGRPMPMPQESRPGAAQ